MSEYIEHDESGVSVGLVEKKSFTFADPPREMVLSAVPLATTTKHSALAIAFNEVAINTDNQDKRGNITRIFPDLRATYGIFLIGSDRSRA